MLQGCAASLPLQGEERLPVHDQRHRRRLQHLQGEGQQGEGRRQGQQGGGGKGQGGRVEERRQGDVQGEGEGGGGEEGQLVLREFGDIVMPPRSVPTLVFYSSVPSLVLTQFVSFPSTSVREQPN